MQEGRENPRTVARVVARPACQRLLASAAHSALLVSARSRHGLDLRSSHHGIPALTQERPGLDGSGAASTGNFTRTHIQVSAGADVASGDGGGAAYSYLTMACINPLISFTSLHSGGELGS